MFAYNFELGILSFLLILVFNHKELCHTQIKSTGIFLMLFWFSFISYSSSGLRDPQSVPGLSTCACLSTSYNLANCPAESTVLESLTFSIFFFTFETSEALLSSWGEMAGFFECSSTRKSIFLSTVLLLCTATLVHKKQL